MSRRLVALVALGVVCAGFAFSTRTGAAQSADAAQASRGEDVYFASCALCHNDDLSGGAAHAAPALAGDAFRARWNGRSAAELIALTRATMPQEQPKSLTDQAYLDVVAFILKSNHVTLADGELTEQKAAQIVLK